MHTEKYPNLQESVSFFFKHQNIFLDLYKITFKTSEDIFYFKNYIYRCRNVSRVTLAGFVCWFLLTNNIAHLLLQQSPC